MRKFKRALSFMLCSVMLLGLFGCGGSDVPAGSGGFVDGEIPGVTERTDAGVESDASSFDDPAEAAVYEAMKSAPLEWKIGQLFIGITTGATVNEIFAYQLGGAFIDRTRYGMPEYRPDYAEIAEDYFEKYRTGAYWPLAIGLEYEFADADAVAPRSARLSELGYDFNVMDVLSFGGEQARDMVRDAAGNGVMPIIGRYAGQDEVLNMALGAAGGKAAVMIQSDDMNGADLPACINPVKAAALRALAGDDTVLVAGNISYGNFAGYDRETPIAVQVFAAGYDMIITKDYGTMYKQVLEAVDGGELDYHLIDAACRRVLLWKYDNGFEF